MIQGTNSTYQQLVEARGSKEGYHFNPIVGWNVESSREAYLADVADL